MKFPSWMGRQQLLLPYDDVPTWLEKWEPDTGHEQDANPGIIRIGRIALVLNFSGIFHVIGIGPGAFIHIKDAKHMTLTGMGKGVYHYSDIISAVRYAYRHWRYRVSRQFIKGE